MGGSFVIARLPKAAEAISWRDMRLLRTFQVLAMTAEHSLINQATTKIWKRGGGHDISDRFWKKQTTTKEVKYEDNT